MKRLLASAVAVAVLLAGANSALAQRPYYRGPAFRFNVYGGPYPVYRPYYAPYYGPPGYYPPPAYYYPPPVYAPPPVIAPGFSFSIGR